MHAPDGCKRCTRHPLLFVLLSSNLSTSMLGFTVSDMSLCHKQNKQSLGLQTATFYTLQVSTVVPTPRVV